MEDIGLKKEKNEQEELTPRSIHSSRLEKRSLRLHSMRLRGAGPIAYTGRSFWWYLELLISADSEVALMLGIACAQPVDDLLEGGHVGLPLVPVIALFTVPPYLLVGQRHRLRPRQLVRCTSAHGILLAASLSVNTIARI